MGRDVCKLRVGWGDVCALLPSRTLTLARRSHDRLRLLLGGEELLNPVVRIHASFVQTLSSSSVAVLAAAAADAGVG